MQVRKGADRSKMGQVRKGADRSKMEQVRGRADVRKMCLVARVDGFGHGDAGVLL
jgi:hypothetical protein